LPIIVFKIKHLEFSPKDIHNLAHRFCAQL
jgi:hypothetical protein